MSSTVPGWEVAGDRLTKTYRFPDFARALAFANAVGKIAEAMGHHPELTVGWGFVTVSTWTHDADGVTEKDVALAAEIESISTKNQP